MIICVDSFPYKMYFQILYEENPLLSPLMCIFFYLVFYSTFSILLKCILLNLKASVIFFLLFSRFARSFTHQFIYKYSIEKIFSFKYLVTFSLKMVHKCAINILKTDSRLFL